MVDIASLRNDEEDEETIKFELEGREEFEKILDVGSRRSKRSDDDPSESSDEHVDSEGVRGGGGGREEIVASMVNEDERVSKGFRSWTRPEQKGGKKGERE